MTHRFFIPASYITPPTVTLPADIAHQLRTVLRLQVGDEVQVLDGSGWEWHVRLTALGKQVAQGQIIDQRQPASEPACAITLYQGTLKAQKFEWVLQKGTEVGINRFVPTLCQRSVAKEDVAWLKKQARQQRIIREAAEQCGRAKLPELAPPLPFAEALHQLHPNTLALFPWEEATETPPLKEILTANPLTEVALFIGPEGGFTPTEAEAARASGAHLVKLGPRILRAETAGLAVAAAILYQCGEWR